MSSNSEPKPSDENRRRGSPSRRRAAGRSRPGALPPATSQACHSIRAPASRMDHRARPRLAAEQRQSKRPEQAVSGRAVFSGESTTRLAAVGHIFVQPVEKARSADGWGMIHQGVAEKAPAPVAQLHRKCPVAVSTVPASRNRARSSLKAPWARGTCDVVRSIVTRTCSAPPLASAVARAAQCPTATAAADHRTARRPAGPDASTGRQAIHSRRPTLPCPNQQAVASDPTGHCCD